MLYRPIGTIPINASVIGLGTGAFGGRTWGRAEENNAIKIIHASLDHGVNFIDTAQGYGNGRSERLIGQVLRERKDQGEIYVATKTPPRPGPWPGCRPC